jgi:hypothetical protein
MHLCPYQLSLTPFVSGKPLKEGHLSDWKFCFVPVGETFQIISSVAIRKGVLQEEHVYSNARFTTLEAADNRLGSGAAWNVHMVWICAGIDTKHMMPGQPHHRLEHSKAGQFTTSTYLFRKRSRDSPIQEISTPKRTFGTWFHMQIGEGDDKDIVLGIFKWSGA